MKKISAENFNRFILKHDGQKGAILLDAIISIIIIGSAFAALLSVGASSIKMSTSLRQATQANSLLEESIEGVRNFRDGTDWTTTGLGTLATGNSNPYHLFLDTAFNPPKWNLVPGPETSDIFTKKIIFDRVSRDPSTHDIEDIYNASHDDPNTIKITAIVAWQSRTLQLITYFTNWK